jgi:hypothetical protein
VFDILVPTIGLFLQHSRTHSSAVKSQIVTQLIFFATSSPFLFKEAAGKLELEVKELLENTLRTAVGVTGDQPTTKPSISLRSF